MIDRETFIEHAAPSTDSDGERPVVVRVAAALPRTTPLAAYAALTGRTTDVDGSPYAFLLESAEKTAGSDPNGAFRAGIDRSRAREHPDRSTEADRHARFSFVGYDPEAVITVEPDGVSVTLLGGGSGAELLGNAISDEHSSSQDAFDRLRTAMPDVRLANFPEGDRQHLQGGLVGFLAYDAVYDTWLSEVGVERPDSRVPDAEFVLTTRTLCFDHAADELSLVCTPVLTSDDDPGVVYDEVVAEVNRVEQVLVDADDPGPGGFHRVTAEAGPQQPYEEAVRRAKEGVRDGEVYQAVVSRERELYGEIDALGLYAALRDINPSPYMYLLAHDDLTLVGASPETLVGVSNGTVTVNPIAGTCPRGDGPVEDRRLAGEMLADDKERAEHTMLVDLARNDVRRVSQPGSVRVEEFMDVLKYSHVQHIESTVTGTLADDADAFDATRATFPAGTLAGAPKIRAMELIDDLEESPRGIYGGGVGYFDWTGDADTAIVIRSATIESLDDDPAAPVPHRITVRAGAGVVADSDPTGEFEETEAKLDGVLAALDRIEYDAVVPEVSR